MRSDADRLDDVVEAIRMIDEHLARGPLDDPLVFDAVRMRLVEIGEAVKEIDADLLAKEPSVPWGLIARMRDHLAHYYFDTDQEVVRATIDQDLPPLLAAARRLQEIA